MRGERKHHDSDIQRKQRAKAARRSIGFSWRELSLKVLFWPDGLDRLTARNRRAEQR